MDYFIDIQHASRDTLPVNDETLTQWAITTLQHYRKQAELTVRIVDEAESQDLNFRYRKKDKPTNVLAFPTEVHADVALDLPLLGDLIICPQVLAEESKDSHQSFEAHCAHILVHGILHLLGYDHLEEDDTVRMQTEEIHILHQLGYANPYQHEE